MNNLNIINLFKNLQIDSIIFNELNNFSLSNLLNIYCTNKYFRNLLNKKLDNYDYNKYINIENTISSFYKKAEYSIGSECSDLFSGRFCNKKGKFNFLHHDRLYNLMKTLLISDFINKTVPYNKENFIKIDSSNGFNFSHKAVQDYLTGFVDEVNISDNMVLFHASLICCPFKDTKGVPSSSTIYEYFAYAKNILRIKLKKNTNARILSPYDCIRTYSVGFPPMSRFKIIKKEENVNFKIGRAMDYNKYVYKPIIFLEEI